MKKQGKILVLASLFLLLTACAATGVPQTQDSEDGTFNAANMEQDMKASDTAILIRKNAAEQTITFQTVDTGARYDLNYTDTTEFYDRYGQAVVLDQLPIGEIADIVISIHSKTLNSLNVSNAAFSISDVDSHIFNMNKGMLSVHDDNYKVTKDLVIVTDSQIGELMDINDEDVLTIRGIGRQVYSVSIEKGHGYVRLMGDESFRGGYIEIGQRIIRPIEERMLVLAPEGKYDMRVTYNGFGGIKPIVVTRNKETVVDISDLKGDLLKMGTISFLLHPSDAKLYINGEETDTSQPVELEYGVYQLILKAEGYTPVKKYISVGQEMANIEITLETADDTESENKAKSSSSSTRGAGTTLNGETISNNSTSSSVSSSRKSTSSTSPFDTYTSFGGSESGIVTGDGDSTTSSDNQLYIDGPEDVEVYYDGTYKGIAPLHFAKTSGTHVITLRKDGYVTKSYTLNLASTTDNETYSFTELIKED